PPLLRSLARPRLRRTRPRRPWRISRYALLLVALDLADRPGQRIIWILAKLAAGPPLPPQVPALVQRLLRRPPPPALLLAAQLTGRELAAELVCRLDQLVDVSHDLLVVHAPTVNPRLPRCGPGAVI